MAHMEGATEFTTRLVGVTFCEGYPGTLHRLSEAFNAGEPVPIRLTRDMANVHDSNAVSVMCVAAGGKIGHLSRRRAELIAPSLDSGHQWRGVVENVMINPLHQEHPGVIVRCWQVRMVTA